MGATIHNIPTLSGADDFRVNGITSISCVDSADLFEQAHAILAFIVGAATEATSLEKVGPTDSVVLGALAGIETMMELAMLAQRNERLRDAANDPVIGNDGKVWHRA